MRWFKNRAYKSGTRWGVWLWTDVDSQYIVRLHLLKTPWFAICLHWILKPDPEPWLHDHPVSFLSIILRGKYAELRQRPFAQPEILVHRWYNFIRASRFDRHRIIFTRKHTLTLCFMGPKTREWGFHTDDGWIGWKRYYERQRRIAQLNKDLAEGKVFLVDRERFYDTVKFQHEDARNDAGDALRYALDARKKS